MHAHLPCSTLASPSTSPPPACHAQVKPRTESGRDAMLRAGVKAAISAGQEGLFSMLGGDHPAK